MYKGIIYKYTAPDGALYIGQTTNIKLRLAKWLTKAGYTKGAVGEHRKIFAPELWTYEVVEMVECGTPNSLERELNSLESYWIGYHAALAKCNKNIKLLNVDKGGGNRLENLKADLIEDFINKQIKRTEETNKDEMFGLIDCFNENGDLKETGFVSQLVRHDKSKSRIIKACDTHEWLGFTTYRKAGECKNVPPCPNRPKKKEKKERELLRIYDVRTRQLIATVKKIVDATVYVGNNSSSISSVIKGGKEQYNGFIIKRGSITPTDREYDAALIKAEMPR